MQDKPPGIENLPAVTERRARPRFRVTSLMYIEIGNASGGIVTSLSENGLALTAADTLGNAELEDGLLRMLIQLPGTPETVEASGEIIWTSPSGKEARVRFVEITDKARELVGTWISNQTSTDGLRPEPTKLPQMPLASSRRGKANARRFSFAESACSRVDPESETGVAKLPEIATEPSDLLPLQVGTATVRDGTEGVVSALEDTAFTEAQNGKTPPAGNEQTTQAASDQDIHQENPRSIPERRQQFRKRIFAFTYAALGEDNGGLVFNLGEGGLALTAAAALQENHFSKMRVSFPDSADWFEAKGRLVWKNDSGKEAGIEFLNLPEEARVRIKEWVLQADSAIAASNEDGIRTSQSGTKKLPNFMEPELPATELIETPASFEKRLFENQAFEEHRLEERARTHTPASSTLFKGTFERALVSRHIGKIKPPRIADYSARPRTGVARKALGIAAGVALAVGGWAFFHRTSLNEATSFITQNIPNSQRPHEATQVSDIGKTNVGARATADSPVQSRKTVAAQTGIRTPSLPQTGKPPTPSTSTSRIAVTNPPSGSERTPREKPRAKDDLERMSVGGSPPRSSQQAQGRAAPPHSERKTESPQLPASAPVSSSESKHVEDKPADSKVAESRPLQISQAFPAQNKDLSASSPSTSSNASQPVATPPVNLETERPLLVPKQPAPPVARTPVITVSFDPFPSILMPKAEKSKKSHQGKSLQMGRLLSRVDPVYPNEAKQQGIEGTVKVHAIFNREGAVQSLTSVSGPPLLVPAAMNAIRQWRYSQTVLGGQAMETEEDVTVLFRLENSAAKN